MFIITTRKMLPSARALARAIGERLGSRVHVTANENTNLAGPVIRWGNRSRVVTAPGIHNGNSYKFIDACTNKRIFSELMNAMEIPCVEIRSGIPERFPVVVRRTLTGFGGAGISVCKDLRDWNLFGGTYWSYWVDFRPELGVHIFNGRILKAFKKASSGYSENTSEFPIRNMSNGYDFKRVDLENYPKLVTFMERFCSKFPILFGRLDVGWDYNEKTYRVIEFNTAPGIATNSDTLEAYTNAFLEVL